MQAAIATTNRPAQEETRRKPILLNDGAGNSNPNASRWRRYRSPGFRAYTLSADGIQEVVEFEAGGGIYRYTTNATGDLVSALAVQHPEGEPDPTTGEPWVTYETPAGADSLLQIVLARGGHDWSRIAFLIAARAWASGRAEGYEAGYNHGQADAIEAIAEPIRF